MRDTAGKVIYVGKAINLRARVTSYFNDGGDGRRQIAFLMEQASTIDNIVCENERQAFLLERDLIGKYKPRYNIRLKDDKSYLCVRVDLREDWPRLDLVRRPENDGAQYFGPFAFSYELKRILELIKKIIPLRTCSDTVFFNRQRPCLEYQIKRCSGPCCLPVDKEKYHDWVNQAIRILQGKVKETVNELLQRMEVAADNLRFEEAIAYRDRASHLEKFGSESKVQFRPGDNHDAFAIYREESFAVVSVIQVRRGRMHDSKNYSLENVLIDSESVLLSCMQQYYLDNNLEIPTEILVPSALLLDDKAFLEARLREVCGEEKISIQVPERGSKHRLLQLAELNAKQHFLLKFNKERVYGGLAKRLALITKLGEVPRRIECVDISNLQGSDTVGAIVSFYDGLPDKIRYRKYRLKLFDRPDDFASIYEVVSRRLTRGAEENTLPDLLIIDGGLGQLSMAVKARDELGLDLSIIALAKSRSENFRGRKSETLERVFTTWSKEPIAMEKNDPLTHLLQRIRDEVHNFVLTFHRQTRRGRVLKSQLDEVPGIGPERRLKILREFGSIKSLMQSSPDEVVRRTGMPLRTAILLLQKLATVELPEANTSK
jgi:excinuclease ABC subunit C